MTLRSPTLYTAGALPQNPSHARHVVTAVLVAHDGARWLPDALQSLLQQSRPPDRIVAVDTDSRDRGPALLADTLGADRVAAAPRGSGFGAAVAAGLRHPAADEPVPSAGFGEPTEWLWLLHDDCAPAREALAELLRAAAERPFAAVFGPKVRDWHDHRVLLEAGVTIDGSGRRETGLEPREYDQGQHDGDRDVLAVSSAGMLVRRDVWDKLGGFDPELRMFRDDIDFCWRVNAAGHKVAVVTSTVVYHAEATARRRRRSAGHPRRVDRRNALYVLFANLPAGALLVAQVRCLLGGALRAVLLLLAKQPANALDEIAALVHVFAHPLRMLQARRRRARNRRRTYSAIRPYLMRGRALSRLVAMLNTFFSGSGPVDSAGRHHAGGEEEADEELLSDIGRTQRFVTHPAVLLAVGLTLVALLAERRLLGGSGVLGGGAMLPVVGGASDLWHAYLAGWHDIGPGTAASMPPATGVLAICATVLGGKSWLAVTVLLLGCVPLSGLAAYASARPLVRHRPVRAWMAATYGLLPAATGAIAAGRLGSAVAFPMIPVIGVLFGRMVTRPRRSAMRAAWGVALALIVALAFVPLVWLLAVFAGVLVALAFGSTRRDVLAPLVVALLAPAVLLGPWLLRLLSHPSMFLLEFGWNSASLSLPRPEARQLLLLSPGGPGMPPYWITGGLLLAGLAALCLRRRRPLIAAGWGVALFGMLIAILLSRVHVPSPDGDAVAAWPGVACGIAGLGVLIAAAGAAEHLPGLRALGGLRGTVATVVAVLACVTPVLAAGVWLVQGVRGPVTRVHGGVLPAYVTAFSDGGDRPRTLVLALQPGGSMSYALLQGRQPVPGADRLTHGGDASQRLDSLVAGMVSGRDGDDGRALAAFGVKYVVLRHPGRHASLARVLDGVPGLAEMNRTSDYGLWRLTGTVSRVRVVGADGSVTVVPSGRVEVHGASIPDGSKGRVVAMDTPADGGWHAELDGTDLRATTVDGWAQGFELPAGGGRLTITRGTFGHDTLMIFQGIGLLVVIVLAAPGGGAEDEGSEQRRAERKARRQRRRTTVPRRARGHRVGRGAQRPATVPDDAADPGDDPEQEPVGFTVPDTTSVWERSRR